MYHYAGNNPVRYTDPDGKSDRIYFIVQRKFDSRYSNTNISKRSNDVLILKNLDKNETFTLKVQTIASRFKDGKAVDDIKQSISSFYSFSLQYLGNNEGKSLYRKQGSRMKGPVFNIQEIYNEKGEWIDKNGICEETDENGKITKDYNAPYRVHSDEMIFTGDISNCSDGCIVYDSDCIDDFFNFLKRAEVVPGDQIFGRIIEVDIPL